MKKQLIIGLCLLLGLSNTQAQEKGHYIYFNGGAGLHNFQYDLTDGTEKGGLGYTFNLGYNYFFSDHWGVGTGVGIQSFLSKATLNYMTGTPSIDTDGQSYEYRTYYKNWKEEQKVLLLDIPIGLSYQTKLSQKWKLQATLGGKISLPISASYETTGGEIETRGYYSQYNVELYGMSQHNFNTLSCFPSEDITINPLYSAFVDFGGLYDLNKNLDLYVGAYLNYGLNNPVDAQDKLLYQEDGTYNGVLGSNQSSNVLPISFGLKVGLTWHLKCNKTAKVVDVQPTPKPADAPIKVEAPQPKKEVPAPILAPTPKPNPYVEARKIAAATDIKFAFDSKEKANDLKIIGNPQDNYLKELAETLKANPNMKLRIVGHTCNISSHAINEEVGLKRAKVVKEKLLSYGAPESQLSVESKAYDEPLVPNTSEENRAKNRRVQLIIE